MGGDHPDPDGPVIVRVGTSAESVNEASRTLTGCSWSASPW